MPEGVVLICTPKIFSKTKRNLFVQVAFFVNEIIENFVKYAILLYKTQLSFRS